MHVASTDPTCPIYPRYWRWSRAQVEGNGIPAAAKTVDGLLSALGHLVMRVEVAAETHASLKPSLVSRGVGKCASLHQSIACEFHFCTVWPAVWPAMSAASLAMPLARCGPVSCILRARRLGK